MLFFTKTPFLLLCFSVFFQISCHNAFFQQSVSSGSVTTIADFVPLPTIQKNGLLFVPVQINEKTYHFMLDTGAGVSALDSQLAQELGVKKLRSAPVGNASNYRQKYEFIEVSELKISGLVFKNTIAIQEDFSSFPIDLPNFGGIVGQPIISKAHWKIDFTHQQIELATTPFAYDKKDAVAYKIGDNRLPYVQLTLLNETLEVLLDTGCSDMLDMPQNQRLSQKLMEIYPVRSNELEVYTLGQQRTIQVKTMRVPEVYLGTDILVKNVSVLFDKISEPKLGAPFFKDNILIIDTKNQRVAVNRHE